MDRAISHTHRQAPLAVVGGQQWRRWLWDGDTSSGSKGGEEASTEWAGQWQQQPGQPGQHGQRSSGASWQHHGYVCHPPSQAMTAIFVEGLFFVLLSITGVRGGIVKYMPKSIALASSGGWVGGWAAVGQARQARRWPVDRPLQWVCIVRSRCPSSHPTSLPPLQSASA